MKKYLLILLIPVLFSCKHDRKLYEPEDVISTFVTPVDTYTVYKVHQCVCHGGADKYSIYSKTNPYPNDIELPDLEKEIKGVIFRDSIFFYHHKRV